MSNIDFLGFLEKQSLIDHQSARRAEIASAESGTDIEHTLLEFGLLAEDALYQSLAEHTGMDFIEHGAIDFEFARSLSLPNDFLQRVGIIPIKATSDGVLLATSKSNNEDAIRSIGYQVNQATQTAIMTPSAIKEALTKLSGANPASENEGAASLDIERLKALANDGPTIQLVNDIVGQAVSVGASDIHFEAGESIARIRFRIDGYLKVQQSLPQSQFVAVVSRLKVMSDLNISEKRRPQDGRIQISVRGKSIDIRLSTLPAQFGESLVLRILDRSRVQLDWSALGFTNKRVNQIEDILQKPNGIFLVTGPTGSGKTTTLYTALSKLNTDTRKIVTVEDPIEYSISGISQVQVETGIEMTFSRALRAILRQDPDVVMVGEIRDQETAEIAVRAALVGRLVLSTIHTNDSLSTITRLIDLGVPPYLLSATLRGVLSQRLLPRVCSNCSGSGCDNCGQSGRKGRVVISELLTIDRNVSEAISAGKTSDGLLDVARSAGYDPMIKDVEEMIASGLIDRDDIFAALGEFRE